MDEGKMLDIETVEENARQADEQEEAESEKPAEGIYVHTLTKPLTIGDTQVTELTFDWDAMSGADHNNACKMALARGVTVVVREYTPVYLTAMAVMACTMRNEKGKRVLTFADLERLPMKDMLKIQDEARLFLRASEL